MWGGVQVCRAHGNPMKIRYLKIANPSVWVSERRILIQWWAKGGQVVKRQEPLNPKPLHHIWLRALGLEFWLEVRVIGPEEAAGVDPSGNP